ncbi:MAG: hypothetical protein M3082_22110 [Candidatus Dormibacteraeota bacterium]|nr:hypothetical protein [Candidatus Dormibacteraeota bacterium]
MGETEEGADILEHGSLKEHLAHWAEVLDRWVKSELGNVNGEAASADATTVTGDTAKR